MVRRVLLLVNGEEHHHHPKGIGVEHGRGIEHDAATKQLQQMTGGHALREESPVLYQEGYSGDEVYAVGNSQIHQHGYEGI